MSTKSGRIASVRLGAATKVAGMGTWTLGGFTRETIEEDSWDLDVKNKYFSVGDAGTISFSGLHDPASNQTTLDDACNDSDSTVFVSGELRFYVNISKYWTVATGGTILITKVNSITLEKSAMGTVDFEAVVEGAGMVYL